MAFKHKAEIAAMVRDTGGTKVLREDTEEIPMVYFLITSGKKEHMEF